MMSSVWRSKAIAAFFAENEGAVGGGVHEEVFGKDDVTGRVGVEGDDIRGEASLMSALADISRGQMNTDGRTLFCQNYAEDENPGC